MDYSVASCFTLHVLRSANYAKKTETTKYFGIYLHVFSKMAHALWSYRPFESVKNDFDTDEDFKKRADSCMPSALV
jgi:hypothetical protein